MQRDSLANSGMETEFVASLRFHSEMNRPQRNRSFRGVGGGPWVQILTKWRRKGPGFGRAMCDWPVGVLRRFCRMHGRVLDPGTAMAITREFCDRHGAISWHENSHLAIRNQAFGACRFDHSGFVHGHAERPDGEFCSSEREVCPICFSTFGVVYSISGQRVSKRICSDRCYRVQRWNQSGMSRGYERHDPPLLGYAIFRINKRHEKLKGRKLDSDLRSGMNHSNG